MPVPLRKLKEHKSVGPESRRKGEFVILPDRVVPPLPLLLSPAMAAGAGVEQQPSGVKGECVPQLF